MEIGNLLFGHSRGNYSIDRETFEAKVFDIFKSLLESVKCDSYGHYVGKNKYFLNKTGGFKCDLFEINPYYWGECDCGVEETGVGWHTDACALILPNFKYRFENGEFLEIRWYKYPFRDSYSNMELSAEEFCFILDDCINYVKTLEI